MQGDMQLRCKQRGREIMLAEVGHRAGPQGANRCMRGRCSLTETCPMQKRLLVVATVASTLASSFAAALEEAGGESIQAKLKSAEWRLTTRGRATWNWNTVVCATVSPNTRLVSALLPTPVLPARGTRL